MRAYIELSTERNADGNIPWTSIAYYAQAKRFNLEELVQIVRIADSARAEKTHSKERHRGR